VRGLGRGLCPLPSFFLLLALKMASLGAFWVVYFYNLSACLSPALTSCQFVSLILTNRMSDQLVRILRVRQCYSPV